MAKNYQTGLIITGDAKGAVKATKLAGDELNKLNRRNKKYARESAGSWDRAQRSLFSLKGAIGAVTSAMVVMQGVRFLDSMIKEQEQLQRQLLRTQAIIKSTNSAAGFSAKELHEQARQAAFATLQSTDGIMQAQQIMLTFKAVTGETFTRAMALANDLSVTIGGNLNSAVTQLGKALQDPVKGMSAMAKSGVSFSEESQALIKSLVDTNQLAKAQGVILDELAGQYQGIAENEAKGLSGAVDTLGQRIEEFKINLDSNESRMAKWVDVVNLAADAVLYLDEAINGINISSVAGMDKQLSKYQAELAVLEEKAKKLDNWFGNNIASTSQENINNEIIAKNQEINSLLTKRAKLLSAIEQKKTEMANQPVQVENSLADSELARVAALLKSIETPQQKYNQSVIELNTFLAAGAITQQEYNLALELYSEQLGSVTEKTDTLSDAFERQLSRLIEQNIRLSSGERALLTYQLAQKGFTAEQKKTALAIYDANKAMEKQKKAAADASKSQKAANKKMADGLKDIDRYLKDISASSQDIFSGPADSINNMANGINAMSKALDVNKGYVEENQKAWAEFNKTTTGTDEERAQKTKEFTVRDNALAKKSIDIKLQGFNTVGSAFVGMFNDMAAASEAGSKKQEALQKTAMGMTMVMATINGVAAVIAAFKDGGFPMAIAVGAAVAAQLATIGVQMASIGGGSSAPELQKTQGRGTVLGDAGAVSESFSNALSHLEDSTDYSLVQSSKMIVFLQNIDNNTKALAIGINRSDQYQSFSASPTFGLGKNLQGDALKMSNAITGFNDMLGSMPVFGGALRGFANALFGYKEDIRDTGVSFNKEQTLGQAKDQGLDANYYARVDTYQKIFGFRTNTDTLNLEQAIEGEILTWFNGIVNNSTDAVLAGLEVLAGDGYAALEDKILNSTLNLEKISLKDLDTAGVEEALAGVFSASADKLVADNFPVLQSFQQVGEGMFETLVRVSHGVEQAQVSLAKFGFQAIDFTEIINKQGDTGGQVAKQTILLNEEFDNIVDVMKNVSGSTEDVIGVYTDLIKTQRLLIASGFGDNVDLVSAGNASGGIGNLQSGIESYRQNFMTDSQRLQADLSDMATDFKTLGVVFPDNINEYTKAVTAAGFDIRTATQEFMKGVATDEDLGRTLQLADAATQLYSDWGRLNEVLRENTVVLQQTYDRLGQSDIEKTLRGIAESFTKSIVSIADAGGTAEQMLQALNLGLLTAGDAIEKAKKSIDDLYKGIYKNIADQKTSLSDAITKLVDPDALFQIQADRYTALLENGSYEEQMQAARSLQDLIISQYQEQGDTITNMIDSVKQIGQYLDSLKLNDTLSVLTPAQMLGEAQGQFQLQLSLARAGDADALSSITDFADTYLNKARSFYASSDAYTGIFDSVTKALGDIKAPDKEDYAKTTSAATTEAVTWLKSISASLDTIKDEQMLNQQNELSTGLSQAQGVRSEFVGGVASATNTNSVAVEGLLVNGITQSLSNKKISDEVIAEYANTHTFKETYDAAIANGISSIELANATGWDRKGIVDWAAQNGLEVFADGGVTNRPAIFGEAGAEAAVPLPDGRSIPVTLSGKNNDALIEEIRALKQEVSELRREQADQTNALIESNYDANEQAAEKVSSTQEDVSWKATQQVEIA